MKCGSPRAAKVPRSFGRRSVAQHAEAAHMGFVDDGVGPRHGGRAIVGPVEAVVGHHRLQHARRAVAPVEGKVGARRVHAIAEQRIGRAQLAGQAPRIGIEQQLVMVEAMAVLRLVGAIGAIAVDQAGARIGQIAVPDLVGAFRQLEALRSRAGPTDRTGRARCLVAWAEKTAKLVPSPSQVAPSG